MKRDTFHVASGKYTFNIACGKIYFQHCLWEKILITLPVKKLFLVASEKRYFPCCQWTFNIVCGKKYFQHCQWKKKHFHVASENVYIPKVKSESDKSKNGHFYFCPMTCRPMWRSGTRYLEVLGRPHLVRSWGRGTSGAGTGASFSFRRSERKTYFDLFVDGFGQKVRFDWNEGVLWVVGDMRRNRRGDGQDWKGKEPFINLLLENGKGNAGVRAKKGPTIGDNRGQRP